MFYSNITNNKTDRPQFALQKKTCVPYPRTFSRSPDVDKRKTLKSGVLNWTAVTHAKRRCMKAVKEILFMNY